MSAGVSPPAKTTAQCRWRNADNDEYECRSRADDGPVTPNWPRQRSGDRQRSQAFASQRINANRLRDVFDVLRSHVLEGVGETVADMVAHRARDADAARCRQPLQPRRDVDAVAINVAAVGNHVAEIDPDAKS